MLDTGILRKKVIANKKDMEKVINILMSIGYTQCSINDSNEQYRLITRIPEKDNNIGKRVYSMYVRIFLVEMDVERVYKFYLQRESCYYYSHILFDYIEGRELIILEFLYRYFKLFQDDIFLNKSGYVYTKEDIEKAYCNKDSNWIYNSPDAL